MSKFGIILIIAWFVSESLAEPENNKSESAIGKYFHVTPNNITPEYLLNRTKEVHLNCIREANTNSAEMRQLEKKREVIKKLTKLKGIELEYLKTQIKAFEQKIQEQEQQVNTSHINDPNSYLNDSESSLIEANNKLEFLQKDLSSIDEENKKLSEIVPKKREEISQQNIELDKLRKTKSENDEMEANISKMKIRIANYQDCCRAQKTIGTLDNSEEGQCYGKGESVSEF